MVKNSKLRFAAMQRVLVVLVELVVATAESFVLFVLLDGGIAALYML
jgi:hypothetical protein